MLLVQTALYKETLGSDLTVSCSNSRILTYNSFLSCSLVVSDEEGPIRLQKEDVIQHWLHVTNKTRCFFECTCLPLHEVFAVFLTSSFVASFTVKKSKPRRQNNVVRRWLDVEKKLNVKS